MFQMSKWSCKPILDIYVPKAFQWYKEHLNPLSFDLYDCPLKIWESTKTPSPKVGVALGVWGFIPHIFLHSWKHVVWLPSFLLAHNLANPFVLLASPRLGLWQILLDIILIIHAYYATRLVILNTQLKNYLMLWSFFL
jgi:hypothetical protein